MAWMGLRPVELLGLALWRGGLLFVAAWSFFRGARHVLRLLELPLQLEVGFGLVVSGLGMLMLSLVLERIQDARAEGDLSR